MLQTVILYAVLLTAVLFDFLWCRIPNALNIAFYLFGMLYFFLTDSLWYLHISDSLLILMITYPFFIIGAFGAGDIKLLAVISIFMGFEGTLHISLLAVFIGAALSILKILYHLATKKEFRFSNLYIHFSLPILIGTIITRLLGGIYLWEMF